jgi:hypothetical protein
MNKRVKNITPCIALLLAQAPIGWAVADAAWAAWLNWQGLLGSKENLPLVTIVAMYFGVAIPVVTAIVATVFLYLDWRQESCHYLRLFITAVCEAVVLAFFALGLTWPALSILYRLGP